MRNKDRKQKRQTDIVLLTLTEKGRQHNQTNLTFCLSKQCQARIILNFRNHVFYLLMNINGNNALSKVVDVRQLRFDS